MTSAPPPAPPPRAPATTSDRGGGVLVGLVLIGLGTVLLLGQLDVVDSGEVLRRGWPVVPVVAGLWWLIRGPRLGGAIVLAAGLLWGASANDLVDIDIGAVFWPVVLVVLGGTIVVAAVRSPMPNGRTQVTVFDDRDWTTSADDLGGSTLVTIFGDADLHLTAPRADGQPTELAVWTVFGDITIDVPAGWRVQDRHTAVFGGLSTPRQAIDPDGPLLILSGLTLFGDTKIRAVPVDAA